MDNRRRSGTSAGEPAARGLRLPARGVFAGPTKRTRTTSLSWRTVRHRYSLPRRQARRVGAKRSSSAGGPAPAGSGQAPAGSGPHAGSGRTEGPGCGPSAGASLGHLPPPPTGDGRSPGVAKDTWQSLNRRLQRLAQVRPRRMDQSFPIDFGDSVIAHLWSAARRRGRTRGTRLCARCEWATTGVFTVFWRSVMEAMWTKKTVPHATNS